LLPEFPGRSGPESRVRNNNRNSSDTIRFEIIVKWSLNIEVSWVQFA
jgi:hypothetical protein